MVVHGSGLKLLNLSEDFYSLTVVETSYGNLLFFPEGFEKCNCLQVINAEHFPTKCISIAEKHGFFVF